jgi:hypothetical protein
LPERTQPRSESTTVTGSDGISAVGSSAFAASRSTIGERRLSPNSSILQQLVAHLLAQLLLRAEDLLQLRALAGQLLLLAADLHLLQLVQEAQFQLEDVFGLRIGKREALHQHRLRLVLGADDADHLVDVEIGDEQPSRRCSRALTAS